MKLFIYITILITFFGCSSSNLRFDGNGLPQGTGWEKYNYKNGQLMLEEFYQDGQLLQSIWYKPDGKVLRKENWINGSGTGIYLREDGSIKRKLTYVKSLAHGIAITYNENGSVKDIKEYKKGKELTNGSTE